MDNVKIPSITNDSQLERQFREKLLELQNNTDSLQATHKKLVEARLALYNMELELEQERGVSRKLRMQLRAATDMLNELQQQQTKNQVESVQLQIKYDAMTKQYDSLMNQTTIAKMRETECKIKIHSLEENLCQKDATGKRLERTLKELERDSSRIATTIDHTIAKLKQEHQHLQKSCEQVISLNHRLQAAGMCTHAIHQKDKVKIKELECMLASISVGNMASAGESINHDFRS